MKSIVCVNTNIPTVDDQLEYGSGHSLRDYDIVIFDPLLPYADRVTFSDGGSCISIADGKSLIGNITHWRKEIQSAIEAGKTVFVILDSYKEDKVAVGSNIPSKGRINYETRTINNYSALPISLNINNSRGKKIIVKDSNFKSLYQNIQDIIEYRVVISPHEALSTSFTAKDGAIVGGVAKSKTGSGSLVFLPYLDFEHDDLASASPDNDDDGDWSPKAIQVSKAFVSQLVAIDKQLKGNSEATPPPPWMERIAPPRAADAIDDIISNIDNQIAELQKQKEIDIKKKIEIMGHSRLLYETGKNLEQAIENVLRLLGYHVGTLRIADLEIDHVFVGPSGKRMIGESEGKDNSAIDITKFRQLESNIGEDFQRCDVNEPAKGVLFGNGFRLTEPESRHDQFTEKCLKNAIRLRTALVKTCDLYPIAARIIDNPDDEVFKAACRQAIEDTEGDIVCFPILDNP